MSSQNSLDVQGFVVRPKRRYSGASYVRRPTTVESRFPAERSILAQMSAPGPQLARSEPSVKTHAPTSHNTSNSDLPTKQSIDVKSPKFNLKGISKARAGMLAMATVLFIAGLLVSLQGLKANTRANAAAKDLVSKSVTNPPGSNLPDETKPSTAAINSYKVDPSLPKYLVIPKIYVKARVQRVGVDSNNQLQTARNLYDVGWYENSSKPGDVAGAILIDGHDLGYTTTGVFYNLKKLTPGDSIQIIRGDNQTFNFKVISTKTYDVNNVDMNAAMMSAVPGKLGLNLITCTGQYDAKKIQFQQRLMVFAVAE